DGQLTPEAEGEQSLLVGRQARNRRPELVVGGARCGGAAQGRLEVDGAWPRGASAELVAADVDKDPREPAVRRSAVAQTLPSIPGEQRCLLNRILGGQRVVQDERPQPVRVINPGEEQPTDGVVRG